MPELTRAGLLDPQTPMDFLLLILIACSGPGALILVWLFFQDWRDRRKMARAARILCPCGDSAGAAVIDTVDSGDAQDGTPMRLEQRAAVVTRG